MSGAATTSKLAARPNSKRATRANSKRAARPNSKRATHSRRSAKTGSKLEIGSPFGLNPLAVGPPREGALDPCELYCEQGYAASNEYPPECGYRRLRENGRWVWSMKPTNRNCLKPLEREGFELESDQRCQVWNRHFTRPQLIQMLSPFVDKPEELSSLPKTQLCQTLKDRANDLYYELESRVSAFCITPTPQATPRASKASKARASKARGSKASKARGSKASARPGAREMRELLALLRLPAYETFYDKKEMCSALMNRVNEMRPPWYSRLWRYVKGKAQALTGWVKENPKKTLLFAAGFIAALYFAPQLKQLALKPLVEWTVGQAERDLAALDWAKAAPWVDRLEQLQRSSTLSPTDIRLRDFLSQRLRALTQNQLVQTGVFRSGFANPTAQKLAALLSPSPTNATNLTAPPNYEAWRNAYNAWLQPSAAPE